MFDFNSYNVPEPFNLFLCQPNGKVMYQLNGINEETASLTVNLNNQFELSFDYFRYINSNDNQLIESNGYHDIVVGMKILVDKIGYFKIKYPPMKFDGTKEQKTINAVSIDCELEDKDLVGFKINTGEKDSLEYLVTYEADETESLINDYTGLPYDYIVFYNTYPEQLQTILNRYSDGTYTNNSIIAKIKSFCDLIPRLQRKVVIDSNGNMSITEFVEYTYDASGENITSIRLSGFNNRVSQLITFYTKYRNQLSLISLAIEKCNCNWKIGSIDNSLVNKKFQFDVDGKNIYSFLTDDISSVVGCIFNFNLFTKEIDIVLAKNIGSNSGVILNRQNFLNTLEVTCNSDSIYTRFNVSGGNKIDIKYVNFGSTRITDLSYFMNARNEQNKRIYVSDILAKKYEQYLKDKEIARIVYISLTKQYNKSLLDIDELKYKVPNDSLQNDWDTFTDAELESSYNTYHQLLTTLQSLYKEDYGNVGCNADGSINENYIRTTEYWYDYYAYKVTIEQITATIHARANGSRYADITNENVLNVINAYKTEWSLYGTVELENKITAYNNSMQVLIDGEAIILKSNSQEAKKWSELNDEEKTEYGFYEGNYRYDAYMKYYNERSSCQTYLNQLNSKLAILETQRDSFHADRQKLVKLIEIESYNRTELGSIVTLPSSTISDTFSNEEIQIINLLYVDGNYSNEHIITTSLDTTVSEVDIQYELLKDAEEQLSIASQPQISFNAEIENLLVIPEFQNFDFMIGNFVTMEYYDDYYVDLRLISMTFNPCIPEDSLSVSFSNFIKSKSERTDVSNILGLAVGTGSSSSSSSGNGSSGNFGDSNDIDVTISNTMLSKLLNTEMFGTRVSNIILDTIKVNEITAKYAKFEGLAKGTTIIDGKCIMTGYIIDQLYDGKDGDITNTKGSVINLETGKFSFGGGKLKYDGTDLIVKGAIYADSGYIGGENGFTIAAGKLYSNGHSSYNTKKEGVYIGTDYISLGNGGVTYFSKDGTGKIGTWYINSSSIYRGQSTFSTKDGMYFGTSGLSISDVFKVDDKGNTSITDKFSVSSAGKLTAQEADIKGNIEADTLTATTSGKIAVWNFNSDAIYKTSSTYANSSGMYFGKSGLSITDKFKVSSTGSFNFGDGKIVFDGTNLTFGTNVTLSWGQITDKDNVANKSDIPTDVNQLNDASGQKWSTTVGDTWIKTANVYAQNLSVASANISGTISCDKLSGGTINGQTINGGTITGATISGGTVSITGNGKTTSMTADGIRAFYIYDDYGQVAMDTSGNKNQVIFFGGTTVSNGKVNTVTCESLQCLISSNCRPLTSEVGNCGTSDYKWNNIYAKSGAVSSSDRNLKKDINTIDSDMRYIDLFNLIKPVTYRFKDSEQGRVHTGFISQEIEEAMQNVGLSSTEFAGFCCDQKYITKFDKSGREYNELIYDEDNNPVYSYSLRYEEFIALNTMMIQRQQKEIQELKNEIQKMKGEV